MFFTGALLGCWLSFRKAHFYRAFFRSFFAGFCLSLGGHRVESFEATV